jgi:A/G-specific adenine glycosylase
MKFPEQLLTWYYENKRDLPWRHTKDPYLIWLSEIIMQQTRVEQGTPYYERFVEAYPTVQQLAAADEQDVLKLWQGLGYYSRARNLHATASAITRDYGGIFPGKYSDIRNLKGIGDYTAAAIASICFDMPHPVMDGNVLRFFSRLFGIRESIDLPGTKKKILAMAEALIDQSKPGDFNQAMMEFGATVCTPANPDCLNCTFRKKCIAFSNQSVEELPVRNVKAGIRHRYLHYMVLTFTSKGKEFVYLNKRTGNGIWKNMYDFPCIERSLENKETRLPKQEFDFLSGDAETEFRGISGQYIHLLTHQKLFARFYRFHSGTMLNLPYMLVELKDIHRYPIPRLIDRYLSETFNVQED